MNQKRFGYRGSVNSIKVELEPLTLYPIAEKNGLHYVGREFIKIKGEEFLPDTYPLMSKEEASNWFVSLSEDWGSILYHKSCVIGA